MSLGNNCRARRVVTKIVVLFPALVGSSIGHASEPEVPQIDPAGAPRLRSQAERDLMRALGIAR